MRPWTLRMVPRESSFNFRVSIVCDKTKLLVFKEAAKTYDIVKVIPTYSKSHIKNAAAIISPPLVIKSRELILKYYETNPKINAEKNANTFAARNI